MKILLYASIVCTLLSHSAFAAVQLTARQKAAYVEQRLNFELQKIGSVLKPGSIRIRQSYAPASLKAQMGINGYKWLTSGDNKVVQYEFVSFVAVDSTGAVFRGKTGLVSYAFEKLPQFNCDGINSAFQIEGKNNGCATDKASSTQFLMSFFDPTNYLTLLNPSLMSEINLNLVPVK